MTPYAIEKAVFDYLSINWTYTAIREINKEEIHAIPFIECYFKPGNISMLEINGFGERVGVFMINIFTKKGVGVQQGNSYGGKLEELFWHKEISGVTCENSFLLPSTKFIGIDDDLQACHHQTIIPFSVFMEY